MRWLAGVLVAGWLVGVAGCGGGSGIQLPDSWTLAANGITVVVTRDPYGYVVRDDTGKVVLSTLGSASDDGYAPIAWTTGQTNWAPFPLTKGQYIFSLDADPWRAGWRVVAASQPDPQTLQLTLSGHGGDIVITHTVSASDLRVEAELQGGTTPRAWSAAFATPPDEGFLGFGERYNRTNQRGIDIYDWAEEGGVGTGEGTIAGPNNPLPNGQAMTYFPVPFFLSTRGYGFWLDTTWRSEFNLATDRTDAWRTWEIGPSLAYEVFLPIPGDSRPWPYHIIDEFTARTGRPMLPPAWTLGPRRRIGRCNMQTIDPDGTGPMPAVTEHEIQAMRDLDLAITGVDDSVHFLPRGSHLQQQPCAGDPALPWDQLLSQWTDYGHSLGYKMDCYYNSLFSTPDTTNNSIANVTQEGLDNGYFLNDADGNPIEVWLSSGGSTNVYQVDFTNPAATAWYQDKLDWAVNVGYDGWMYDFGEYVQPETVGANGMTGEELHNLYPVLYDKAAHDHLETTRLAGQYLTFARSGYTGSQQYTPMVWSGDPAASFEDSDGLPSMARAGINLGVSGVPQWGGDIGGYHCIADGGAAANGELIARWIEQGSMSPNMQDQNACAFQMDSVPKATIWSSPDAMAAWKKYARLHTRLFPYLWKLANDAHATGAPYMRHVFLENPDRPDLASVDEAYYLGPALYVAPVVTRGATTKDVDLPDGWYLDWDAQKLIAGGGMVTLDAPLSKLPLLLRDGYLVPMLDPSIDTLMDTSNAAVVGPSDVSGVYDVVGLLSTTTGSAEFSFVEGGQVQATWAGGFAAPAGLTLAPDEASLADCAGGCYLMQDLGGGLLRVRITQDDGQTITAGGLTVSSTNVGRRIRWDLYLVQ